MYLASEWIIIIIIDVHNPPEIFKCPPGMEMYEFQQKKVYYDKYFSICTSIIAISKPSTLKKRRFRSIVQIKVSFRIHNAFDKEFDVSLKFVICTKVTLLIIFNVARYLYIHIAA